MRVLGSLVSRLSGIFLFITIAACRSSTTVPNPCKPNPCTEENRTKCNNVNGQAVCSCDVGYHEDASGKCVKNSVCAADSCHGRGTCDDKTGVVVCTCQAGYSGTFCERCAPGFHDDGTGTCVLDQQCLPNTCAGHGTCNDTGGVVSCTCDDGYTGNNCEKCASGYHRDAEDRCVANESCATNNPCGDHGTCDDSTGVIECSCDAGWAGELCNECAPGYHDDGTGACVLDQQCLPNTCSGHGTCSVQGGVVSCSCDTGYAGAWCQQCASGYHRNPTNDLCEADESCTGVTCSGHGTCQLVNGLATCFCNQGYVGENCEACAPGYHLSAGACVLDETCDGVTCSGHGTCSVQGGVARCTCDVGYAGADCSQCYPGYQVNQITGVCEIPCHQGWNYIRCNGQCVYGISNENCGGCGATCTGAEQCEWDGQRARCVCPSGPLYDPNCNGLCTNLAYDEFNCGACGNICGESEKCLEGRCMFEDRSQCPPWPCGEESLCCNGSCQGVWSLNFDPFNCGGCHINCNGIPCVLGNCYAGDSIDCNGGAGCPEPMYQVCCSNPYGGGPDCVWIWEMQWDTRNCGACQNTCAQNEQCIDGVCRCPLWDTTNYRICYGQCTIIYNDEENCGECGVSCAADQICLHGSCISGNAPNNCNGECVAGKQLCCLEGSSEQCLWEWDLVTAEHCGGCDPCGPNEECFDYTCHCPSEWGDPSFAVCDGVCIRIDNPENCGSCGNRCDGDEQCRWVDLPNPPWGRYECFCPFPDQCNGLCTDILHNREHCGGCNQPCAPWEFCDNGTCRLAVVINEVYYDGPSPSDDHWVFTELWGVPGFDLSGMKLVGINGADNQVYATVRLDNCGGKPCRIGPDGYFLIAHSNSAHNIPATVDLVNNYVDWQNGPDSVQLRTLNDIVLDALAYGNFGTNPHAGEGNPAVDVAAGHSLCRMGHIDTNNNSLDFFESLPTPRADCPANIDWAVLQWPYSIKIHENESTELIFGQIYIAGITDRPGDSPVIHAQLGYGPRGVDPQWGWQWFDAVYNLDVGNNNEYMHTLENVPGGNWDYAYRFRVGDGSWVYADRFWDGSYNSNDAGKLTVIPWCIQDGFDLGSSLGLVATGTTCGQANDLLDSLCYGWAPGEDVAYMWTAPEDGVYRFQLCQPTSPWEAYYEIRWNCEKSYFCQGGFGGCTELNLWFYREQMLVLVLDSSRAQCGEYTIEINRL